MNIKQFAERAAKELRDKVSGQPPVWSTPEDARAFGIEKQCYRDAAKIVLRLVEEVVPAKDVERDPEIEIQKARDMCSELSLELLGKEADIAGRDAEIKELERQNDELRAEKADLEDRLADAQRGQESVQRELESERLVRKAEEMTTSRLRGERDIAMLEESRHRTTIASLQPLLRTLGHSIVNVAGMLDDGSNQTPPF